MSAGLHLYLLSGRIDTPAQLRVAATRMLEDGSALMNASLRALWLGTGTSVRSTPLAEAAARPAAGQPTAPLSGGQRARVVRVVGTASSSAASASCAPSRLPCLAGAHGHPRALPRRA